MAANTQAERDWVVSPGEVLAEALEERGMSQSELARRMGRPVKTVNEIINAKAAITPETALQLELVLGVSASLWTGLEAAYRRQLAEQRALEGFSRYRTWLQTFPLRDLARYGFVDRTRSAGRQVAQLLAFFEVANPDAWERRWESPSVAYRQSAAFRGSVHARAAWLRWGEIIAGEMSLAPYHPDEARRAAGTLRSLTRTSPLQAAVDEAQDALRSAGIALVVTPEFEGARLSGAARWLAKDAAVVQLSLRHKTDDHLWFSCMHEIGHLLDRPNQEFLDPLEPEESPALDPSAEERADEFARNALVDPEAYRAFVAIGVFTQATVRDFATEQGIAPGIVVGRLQFDGYLRHNQLNHLKKPVRFE